MKSQQHLKKMVRVVMSEIKQNLEDFCKDRGDEALTPEVAAEVTHGLQEATVSAACEGYRTFIESYDRDVPTIQINGITYRNKGISPKDVLSSFGFMKVKRHLYQPDRGGRSHAPLDVLWGMKDEYATPEVREASLFTLAHVTATETANILKKCAPFHPSATAIQAMAERAGAFIEAHEEELSAAIRQEEEVPPETQSMVVSMDGVNVLMRKPGPRKGRTKERPDSTSKEEPSSSYRNAMVGSISLYGEVPEEPEEETTPERLESRYISCMPEEKAVTFKGRFEEEVKETESKVSTDVIRVMLCDGALNIWNYVDANPLFEGYEKLVDFYHTSEHLSKAAEAIFGKSSWEADDWYEKWYEQLKEEEGTAGAIIRSIDYYIKSRPLSKRRLQDLRKERTFFRRNKKRMKYASFINRGLPIGSGPVEAACKTIVKTRLCRSGMRWSCEGGQHILHLRNYLKSDRWDSFWSHYHELKMESLAA
jgi:hypothetical protein